MTEPVIELRGANLDFLKYKGPEVCLSGPAGTGKSIAGLLKVHLRALSVPGYRATILRQTHASLTASTLVSFEQQVIPYAQSRGMVKWFGGSGAKPAGYYYSNGSSITVGGLDQPGKVLSTEYTDILVDEANQVSKTAIEVLTSRLRHNAPTYRQLICLTNPDSPSHHLKIRSDAGTMKMMFSQHRDNPRFFLPDGTATRDGVDYLSRLDALSGVRRARYRDGLWVAAEGQVWPAWSDAVHVVDAYGLEDTVMWVESLDFGFQHCMTWGRFAIDSDGRMTLVSEMSRRHRLVEDFARDILEIRKANGWGRPDVFATDHAAGERATLERHLGEATMKARKDVIPGIQAVDARLMAGSDGRPRFQVFRNSLVRNDPLASSDRIPRGLVAEITGYVWATERGTDGVPREVPKKINDDSCDMLRYAVMAVDGMPPSKLGNPAVSRQQSPAQSSRWNRPTGKPK